MLSPTSCHGLPAVLLRTDDGASAVIVLQGAHVVSWIPAGGGDWLYVSPRSPFRASEPIRGGVPMVFPQFALHQTAGTGNGGHGHSSTYSLHMIYCFS